MFDEYQRVLIARSSTPGTVCGICMDPCAYRVFVDGCPWWTSCSRHAPALVDDALASIGLRKLPRSAIRIRIREIFPT